MLSLYYYFVSGRVAAHVSCDMTRVAARVPCSAVENLGWTLIACANHNQLCVFEVASSASTSFLAPPVSLLCAAIVLGRGPAPDCWPTILTIALESSKAKVKAGV